MSADLGVILSKMAIHQYKLGMFVEDMLRYDEDGSTDDLEKLIRINDELIVAIADNIHDEEAVAVLEKSSSIADARRRLEQS